MDAQYWLISNMVDRAVGLLKDVLSGERWPHLVFGGMVSVCEYANKHTSWKSNEYLLIAIDALKHLRAQS